MHAYVHTSLAPWMIMFTTVPPSALYSWMSLYFSPHPQHTHTHTQNTQTFVRKSAVFKHTCGSCVLHLNKIKWTERLRDGPSSVVSDGLYMLMTLCRTGPTAGMSAMCPNGAMRGLAVQWYSQAGESSLASNVTTPSVCNVAHITGEPYLTGIPQHQGLVVI